jgi:hypothetical protein
MARDHRRRIDVRLRLAARAPARHSLASDRRQRPPRAGWSGASPDRANSRACSLFRREASAVECRPRGRRPGHRAVGDASSRAPRRGRSRPHGRHPRRACSKSTSPPRGPQCRPRPSRFPRSSGPLGCPRFRAPVLRRWLPRSRWRRSAPAWGPSPTFSPTCRLLEASRISTATTSPTRLADGPEPPGQASAPVRVDTPYEPKVELAPEVSALPRSA